VREGPRVVGLSTTGPDSIRTIRAKIVVGADGAFSKVREALKIPADLYLYPDGYLIAILESEDPVSEAFYYIGERTILGLFRQETRSIFST
jgi:2-polyprenyl-6-methoxyphenol hydroxylase-like FAD-dependent oxidoreductase